MYSRTLIICVLLFLLAGCNLRENDTLPSGISPFELIDGATYINGAGVFSTPNPDVYVKVTEEEPEGFGFVEKSYNFSTSSPSYFIKLVDEASNDIINGDFSPLLAFPSEQFTYLGLKYQGDYERFYPYPHSSSINSFSAYYDIGCCYFILSDSGYYQTVYETSSHYEVTVEIDPTQDTDINVSLYQAQFILPRNLVPLGIQRIKLEKRESNNLAEYNLILSDFPVSFNMIQNNPDEERYPILYIPVSPETDMTKLSVKQIFPDNREVVFHYTEVVDSLDQFTTYGNCVILLVNNQGKFIIN
jgi:hypothetical protein